MGETLADGLAGNIEPGAVTFELVRDHVAAVVSASEPELEEAVRFLARAHGIVAEGAGAAAVAGVMAGRVERGAGPMVIVVTGRNIALPRLAEVLAGAGRALRARANVAYERPCMTLGDPEVSPPDRLATAASWASSRHARRRSARTAAAAAPAARTRAARCAGSGRTPSAPGVACANVRASAASARGPSFGTAVCVCSMWAYFQPCEAENAS